MRLEDLRLNANVVSRDGHKLGNLSRFVIDKDAQRLTHIVVDTGIFRSGEALWKGGWGMAHDRVVPFGCVVDASEDEVRITMSAEEFKDLARDYNEEYFVEAQDVEPGEIDPSDVRRFAMAIPGEPGPYLLQEVTAKQPWQEEINRDSPVWRLNPHEKIGEVERAIIDEDTGVVNALVIKRGFVFTSEKVLPQDYIVEVAGGIVRVDIDDEGLKGLEEFAGDE